MDILPHFADPDFIEQQETSNPLVIVVRKLFKPTLNNCLRQKKYLFMSLTAPTNCSCF